MAISASDVKRLREETDAPMMECKAALEEAGGDFERAKEILREKGKAAAAKRSERSTSEGIAKFASSDDHKKAAGVVVECETDFVANSEPFRKMVDTILAGMLAAGEAGPDVMVDGKPVSQHIQEAVAVIRENIVLKHSLFIRSHDGIVAIYNHHTRKEAAAIELFGSASNLLDVGFQVAVQTVAGKPEFLKKEDVPKGVIEKEIEIETKRAIDEGKDPKIAENIARGRVNKEYFQTRVLLEQPFYTDTKKSTSAYVAEEANKGGGKIEIVNYARIVVGQAS